MNDKEKKAIGMCRLLLNGDITLHVIDDDGGTAYAGTVNKTYNDDLEIILNLIENQKAELEKKDKIIDLIVEDFQNDGYLKGMSREEILDHYQERLWLKKQRNPLPLKLDIVG